VQLDALVLSLLSAEPALRPRGAFEVMQRLSAIADLEYSEPLSVTHAYLATPSLVARDEPLETFRKAMRRARRRRGGGLLIEATRQHAPNVRSRCCATRTARAPATCT